MRKYNVINTLCTAAANVGAVETMCTSSLRSAHKLNFLHVIATNVPLIAETQIIYG